MNSKQPEVTRSPIMMAALQYMHGKSEGVEMNLTLIIAPLFNVLQFLKQGRRGITKSYGEKKEH